MTDQFAPPPPMPAPQGDPYPAAPQPPKKKMGKGAKIALGSVGAVIVLGLIGALGSDPQEPVAAPASSSSSAPAVPAAAPTPSETSDTPTSEDTPTPEGMVVGKFGSPGSFTQEGTNAFTVTVNKPTKPKCPYSSSSLCDKPETGDRYLTFKVAIKNEASEAIEVSYDSFVLEFGDGTRMEPDGGNAYVYSPDNKMDYGHQIRPGATYSSTLTFEAPKDNNFKVIMTDGSFKGEDLYAWTF